LNKKFLTDYLRPKYIIQRKEDLYLVTEKRSDITFVWYQCSSKEMANEKLVELRNESLEMVYGIMFRNNYDKNLDG